MTNFDLSQSIGGIHRRLVAQLQERRQIPHTGTAGSEGELLWLNVLAEHLPRRYAIRRGIVIDSRGARSDAIDLIVYDPQYTPVFLAQDEHAYVFAEAVYAVIEVKTSITAENIRYAGDKAASVRGLHRTSAEIVHAGGTHQPRPLFPILGGVVALEHNWPNQPEAKFREHCTALDTERRLDFALSLEGPGSSGVLWKSDGKTADVETGAGTFVLFLYALLDRLQQLGTVPAVAWPEYMAHVRQLM